MVNPNMPTKMGGFRPCNSENGPQTSGPNAYPRTYNDVERVAVTVPTRKTWATACVEEENKDEVNVLQRDVYASIAPI